MNWVLVVSQRQAFLCAYSVYRHLILHDFLFLLSIFSLLYRLHGSVTWNPSSSVHSPPPRLVKLVLFPPEWASFCEASFSSCRLAEDCGTADTQHYGLSVTEHCGDLVATWTFHIHKIGIGTLYKTFFLVSPLFLLGARVQQILCERHVCVSGRSPEDHTDDAPETSGWGKPGGRKTEDYSFLFF